MYMYLRLVVLCVHVPRVVSIVCTCTCLFNVLRVLYSYKNRVYDHLFVEVYPLIYCMCVHLLHKGCIVTNCPESSGTFTDFFARIGDLSRIYQQ